MNARISQLRAQSLQAPNRISAERARLVTQFYQQEEVAEWPVSVQRARCFEYILANKHICINPGELIVGERGPAPKATPTYPEICLHSLEDLDVISRREKVSFDVDQDTRDCYEKLVIPFWKGKSIRDRVMRNMTPEWIKSYRAGIFTEFQEQRAPGHTVLGDKIYRMGMSDLRRVIRTTRKSLERKAALSKDRAATLEAMDIAAAALIHYAERHARELEHLAGQERNENRAGELTELAAICRHVPRKKPRTFHEALQYYWFVHLGVITELNPWDSFNPGRLDQHLLPFFLEDLEAGRLTREGARELLQAFWIKFNNHPSPPKVGITAQESSTYTDFSLINIGGLTAGGEDAVNELSYLILEVIEEMRLLQPGSMVQISRKTPDAFLLRALDIIRTGFGQPSCFNTDAIVQQLVSQGKNLQDARKGGASGCVETGAFGTECYILTGYFNLPGILEITLHNGLDPSTGAQLGPATGSPSDLRSFEELTDAYRRQVDHFLDIKIRGSNRIESIFAAHMPVPFLSLLIDDCITNAKDYNAGGARYNTSYIQGVGTGSLCDSMAALRHHVFECRSLDLDAFVLKLDADFRGDERFRHDLLNHTPKYGNDDARADDLLGTLFDIFHDGVTGRKSPRGATYRINLLPTTSHVYFGSVTGAMPDGRKAGEPFSEGISPVQGADRKGPTAVLKSAAKIDHLRTGGTLLNQKFSPSLFERPENRLKLARLIRAYFQMHGHHIQFNVVTAGMLRAAQREPEKYKDLIVRVAGYSDYFNDLGRDLQDEIIRRTEHSPDF